MIAAVCHARSGFAVPQAARSGHAGAESGGEGSGVVAAGHSVEPESPDRRP